ncbi:DUF3667 domain-containing protein [Lysobacter claricitrinus]|uniref:DUF3667 domain-containing protein n=1 Tax=Lysobacter claricitrinus TaxID=3367728 RepID=UPI0037DBAD76
MHADTPIACDNCGTMLQGHYCHACGQNAHNPLSSFTHALEEVFESFWHLDGRAFRTFRDLFVPGRVACNYLRGHRVRYIPPLRLFLVLVVITFFVGRLTVSDDDGVEAPSKTHINVVDTGKGDSSFDAAKTEAEVQKKLTETIEGINTGREKVKNVPFMARALDTAEAEARAKAAARIAELRTHAPPAATAVATPPAKPNGVSLSVTPTDESDKESTKAGRGGKHRDEADDDSDDTRASMDKMMRGIRGAKLRDPKLPWDAKTNPADLPWLPDFGDRWFNHRIANFADNVDRMKDNGTFVFQLMLAAVPSALFLMLPLFALMLKVLYLGSGRTYLEHLVVALYSHAFLLFTLFASFVLALSPLSAAVTVPVTLLLWLWAGIYLLLMQHRVYGQHWAITIGKYLVVAFLYQFLIIGASVYTAFAGLTSAH